MVTRKSAIQDKETSYWRYLSFAAAVVFALVPFHAFFTTWMGASFGNLDVFVIWKEFILLGLATGVVWIMRGKLLAMVRRDILWLLIAVYAGWFVLYGLFALARHAVTLEAVAYSLIINLRFLLFFVVVWAIVAHYRWLRRKIWKLILWPAAIVVVFGLLQHFVLPVDFLRHFGYGPDTIPAFQGVDQKTEYARVQSTLRGANPLGAYLLVVLTLLAVWMLKLKRQALAYGLLAAGSAIVLFYTYSRSAWLGFAASLAVIAGLGLPSKKHRRTAGAVLVGSVLVLAAGFLLLRTNDTVENVLFHTDEHSKSADTSNEVRLSALQNGVRSLITQPLGTGPGTAGPASFRNNNQPVIAENYYVQVGQEVGLIGMGLFIAIIAVVGVRLWRQRHVKLALAALASLVGLSLVNMLSHAWADDTLAYVWWGLAAVSLSGNAILKGQIKHISPSHEETEKI